MKRQIYIVVLLLGALALGSHDGYGQTSINLPVSGAGTPNPAGNNVLIYDNGGATGSYSSSLSGYVYLTAQAGASITISGSYDTESSYDYFKIFTGNGTGGTLVSNLSGTSAWFTYTGTIGTGLTIQLTSDGSVQYTGLNLLISYSTTTTLNVPSTGNNAVSCGTNTVLFDHGGRGAGYSSSVDGYTVLNCSGTGQINIRGPFYTEASYDFIRIYAGSGTGGALLATYSGAGTTNSAGYTVNYTGAVGQILSVRFSSDGSVQYNGFELAVMYITNCCVAPGITTNPTSATKCVGDLVTFNVVASGTPTLNYQWKKNGVNIGGATSTSYTISPIASGDAANYTCYVSNACGNVTSNIATLTVHTQSSVSGASVAASPNPVCLGNSTAITLTPGTLGSDATWTWYAGGCGSGGSIGTGLSINKSPGSATTYYVRAESPTCANTGCVNTAVNVDATPPASVNAGEDQYTCAGIITMAATGTGTWTQVSGPNTPNIVSNSSPTTQIGTTTALISGTYVFAWSASNACGTASDYVVVVKQ